MKPTMIATIRSAMSETTTAMIVRVLPSPDPSDAAATEKKQQNTALL